MQFTELLTSSSGIFTIRQYRAEGGLDILELLRSLRRGAGEVQEVISYVFDGEDPLELDTRSMTPGEFEALYPKLDAYGPELAFDIIIRTQGHPVTVELTWRADGFCTNSLDGDARLEDFLGLPEEGGSRSLPGDDAAHLPGGGSESLSENAADPPVEGGSGAFSRSDAGRSSGKDPGHFTGIASVHPPGDDMAHLFGKGLEHLFSAGASPAQERTAFRAAAAAMLAGGLEEYSDVSIDRVIRMCLLRGLGDSTAVRESAFCLELVAEMEAGRTAEARLVSGIFANPVVLADADRQDAQRVGAHRQDAPRQDACRGDVHRQGALRQDDHRQGANREDAHRQDA